jgi:glutamine cyclotransferase
LRLFILFDISFDAVTKTVTVKYQDNEVSFINELEYINGEVWANVWQVRLITQFLSLIVLISHVDMLVKISRILTFFH